MNIAILTCSAIDKIPNNIWTMLKAFIDFLGIKVKYRNTIHMLICSGMFILWWWYCYCTGFFRSKLDAFDVIFSYRVMRGVRLSPCALIPKEILHDVEKPELNIILIFLLHPWKKNTFYILKSWLEKLIWFAFTYILKLVLLMKKDRILIFLIKNISGVVV